MPSSRLAKKQQKTLLKQTVWLVIITIVILVGFLGFVLPNIVRFAFNFLDTNSIFVDEDTIPPQTPILTAPVEATNSATLSLSGFTEPKATVKLVLNQEEKDETAADDEGKFEFEVSLSEGDNELAVYSVDKADNESSLSKKYTVTLDQTAPTINIESPENGSTIELSKNQLTTIVGQTEPNAKVYLNDRLVFADRDGYFSAKYNLNEGENVIQVKSIDPAGNTTAQELKITFRY